MTWLCDFWRSSIGGKVTMAVTGLLLFGFVVALPFVTVTLAVVGAISVPAQE